MSATGLHSGIPLVFANKVNKPVADYLKENRKRNCGIVFIDFIESSGGQKLVEYLVAVISIDAILLTLSVRIR